jgi:hypothetical protein
MLKLLDATWSAGVRAGSNCRRYSLICSRFHNALHIAVCGIPSSRLAHHTDFWGLRTKATLTLSTPSSDTCRDPELLPVQRHPVILNCWYHQWMLLSDGSVLNWCRKDRCTETTKLRFASCKTQNTLCSGVAIMYTGTVTQQQMCA